jgi:crotonobetainyl-CoA:carnitine CoA-transferase CaiB-like acyl-CoA transferase
MKWIGEQGGLEADLMKVDWTHWIQLLQEEKLSLQDANRGVDQFLAYIRTMTKAEIQEQAVAQKWLIAPVNLAPDLINDPQLKARNFWVDVDGSTLPGPFAVMSETPIVYERSAPTLGQDQALLNDATRTPSAPTVDTPAPRSKIFEGLKVADFSWIAAGPIISKDLANLGATVLRVETEKRLDTLRFLPPFIGEPGITTGHHHPQRKETSMSRIKFALAATAAAAATLAASAAHASAGSSPRPFPIKFSQVMLSLLPIPSQSVSEVSVESSGRSSSLSSTPSPSRSNTKSKSVGTEPCP